MTGHRLILAPSGAERRHGDTVRTAKLFLLSLQEITDRVCFICSHIDNECARAGRLEDCQNGRIWVGENCSAWAPQWR